MWKYGSRILTCVILSTGTSVAALQSWGPPPGSVCNRSSFCCAVVGRRCIHSKSERQRAESGLIPRLEGRGYQNWPAAGPRVLRRAWAGLRRHGGRPSSWRGRAFGLPRPSATRPRISISLRSEIGAILQGARGRSPEGRARLSCAAGGLRLRRQCPVSDGQSTRFGDLERGECSSLGLAQPWKPAVVSYVGESSMLI